MAALHRRGIMAGGLATPGGGGKVHMLREELDRLHQKAKSNVGDLAGGGVSLWPEMDNMRLSRGELWRLVALCCGLFLGTLTFFLFFHGGHVSQLKFYSQQLENFHSDHPISHSPDLDTFSEQLLSWHRDFRKLHNDIHQEFDIVWEKTSYIALLSLLLYIVGIATLLYFLVENMLSKSRLTPARIKVWVSLLCVMTVWTGLILHMLSTAHRLEAASRAAVYSLNEELGALVESSWDLSRYHSVLEYWSTRCLPPRSPGVLSVLGVVQVQDLLYYLQYYSLPVLTAILAPFVRVILALKTVYSV